MLRLVLIYLPIHQELEKVTYIKVPSRIDTDPKVPVRITSGLFVIVLHQRTFNGHSTVLGGPVPDASSCICTIDQ